jgi:glycosyltransferase involved in cell wall biosynthesis
VEQPLTAPEIREVPAGPAPSATNREQSILYVIGSLDIGGAERHLASITPRLKQCGWQPTIYCLTGLGGQAAEVQRAGVTVVGPPLTLTAAPGTLFKALAIALSCLRLFGVLMWRRPRIVHFFLPASYIIGAPLALLARIPIRLMSRRSLNVYQLNHPYLRRLEPHLHRHMSALLGNSKAVVRQLIEEGSEPRRTALIYNGIDIVNDAQMRQDSPSEDKPLTLIIVANLIPYKAHVDLFHALANIAARLPPSWQLLCVGRDTGYGQTLAELARSLQLEANIRFLDERRDIEALLAAAHVGILCSHEEGFSNAILESMAAGLPMVVTDVGGNAEAVSDGVTGLVVPASNAVALGEAILRLGLDTQLRRAMGRAARERVETVFPISKCVERYDALYRGLLQDQLPGETLGRD